MLLQKYRFFHSQELEEVENLLRTVAGGEMRAARFIQGGKGFRCNAVQSDILPMFYLVSSVEATFDFQPVDYVRLVFQVHSASKIIIDGTKTEVDAGDSYILPEGRSVTEVHPSGYRSLAIRIKPDELKRKLTALCGVDVPEAIVFEQPRASDKEFIDFVRRPLFSAARELDASNPLFHPNLLQDVKAVTLTRLLLFAPHNFSALLRAPLPAPSRSQMDRAEEYLANDWDKAVNVADVAAAVGVSGRTILRYFRERHGETPRDYIRRLRLDKTRQLLMAGGEGTTVSAVALRCGFSSLGHFAESYRRRFGELPSETLKGDR